MPKRVCSTVMLALALLLTSGWSFVSRTYGREIQAKPGDRIEVQHDGLTDKVTVSGRMTDLEGYWRVREGPAQGWLMRGRNHEGRKVSLDTAPGVVLSGAWRDKDMLDLRQDRAGTTAGILKVRPPAVLRELLDAATVGTGQGQALHGEADDAFPSRYVMLQKELWRIEIDKDKSQSPVWFDPAAVESVAAKVARVRLERRPYDFTFRAMNSDKFIAVRVRVLGAAGKQLGEPVTVTAAGERSVTKGAVTLEISGEAVYAIWTGLRDDGTPYPPGDYTLELVVRDGMAEAVLTHQVSLGGLFQILAVPDHFAPEHEQVEIAYTWFPERLAPATVRLIVRGGRNGQEVVHDAAVFPQQTSDGWKVQWSGRTHRGAAVDWARLKPFHIELEAVGRDGARRNAKAETSVDVKVVGLNLPPPEELKPPRPQGEAARWYEDNEIPADVAFIFAYVTVTILDSQGQGKKVKQGVNIRWEYTLEPEDTTDQPRPPGFYSPERSGSAPADKLCGEPPRPPEAVKVVPIVLDEEEQKGRSAVCFQLPARATRQDTGTRAKIAADRFSLKASLVGLPEVADQSQTFTIGPGRPHKIEPISLDQLNPYYPTIDRENILDEVFASEPLGDLTEYVDNLATYLVDTGLADDLLGLKEAFIRQLADQVNHPTRYIGRVRGVPYRSYLQTRPIDLPIFLGGYAGEDCGKFRGGQAVVAVFQVLDAFNNPIPVTGDKARTIRTSVSDTSRGVVPPFVVTSATGDEDFEYGARVNYSPFGQATMADPFAVGLMAPSLGMHGIYYVAGIQPITTQLSTEIEALSQELERYGEKLLVPPPIPEIDDFLTVYVTVDGQKTAELTQLQLCAPGTVPQPHSVLAKWVKWLVFAEVSDLETFKAEVVLSIIPVVGDGRDLIIYYLKKYRGDTPGTLDDILWYLAAIGLLSDLGDVNPIGLGWNALVSAVKAMVKGIKTVTRGVGKFADATVEFLTPLVKVTQDVLKRGGDQNFEALKKTMVTKAEEALPLVRGVVEGVTGPGGLRLVEERVTKLAKFLEGCNPVTCLRILSYLEYQQIGKLLDKAAFALDDLYELGIGIAKKGELEKLSAKQLDELKTALQDMANAVLRLGGRVGESVTDRILTLVRALGNPAEGVKVLDTLARLDQKVLDAADRCLPRTNFSRL